MNAFLAAFWTETLKARRSKISLLSALGFLLLPLIGGLFMIILKNPEQARNWGLITAKAQITVGTADWQSFFQVLSEGTAVTSAVLFSLITSWVFGREFSDRTAKELLALPTPRWVIIAAKFVLIALWAMGLVLALFVIGLAIGAAVGIPGWNAELQNTTLWSIMVTAFLTLLLMPLVAFFASYGRGYLPPMGWTLLVLAFANIVSVLGWGDWFPWAVAVLVSGMVKVNAAQVGLHSYVVVLVVFLIGIAVTVGWWQSADQTK